MKVDSQNPGCDLLPTPWGKHVVTPEGVVQYNVSTPHDDKFVATSGFMVINLHYDETEIAVNSDNFQNMRTPKDCTVFVPPNTEVYERSDGNSEVVIIDIQQTHWLEFADLAGIANDREPRFYNALFSKQLGQIGRNFRRLFCLGSDDNLLMESMIIDAHRELASTIRLTSEIERKYPLSTKVVIRLRDYIEANLENPITLEDLAKQADLSAYHFVRAFKDTTGTTPYREVIERRVRLARALLKERNHSIADIALQAGFSSQSHMTSVFNQTIGVTPGRYRATPNS